MRKYILLLILFSLCSVYRVYADCDQVPSAEATGVGSTCSDTVDNNFDGKVDAADPNCGGAAATMTESPTGTHTGEAEAAAQVAPFACVNDPLASGGGNNVCRTTTTFLGSLTHTANITVTGDYYAWICGKSTTTSDNSFSVGVNDTSCGGVQASANNFDFLYFSPDTAGNYKCDRVAKMGTGTEGSPQTDPLVINFSTTGNKNLTFCGLDPNAFIDKVWLTNDVFFFPGIPDHTALKTDDTYTANGAFAESDWAGANERVFTGSDNTTKVKLLHDSTNLYIGITVLDTYLCNSGTNNVDKDSNEVLLDPKMFAGPSRTTNHYKIIDDINNNVTYLQGTGSWTPSPSISIGTAVTGDIDCVADGDTEWREEIIVPWAAIGGYPGENKHFALNIQTNDKDASRVVYRMNGSAINTPNWTIYVKLSPTLSAGADVTAPTISNIVECSGSDLTSSACKITNDLNEAGDCRIRFAVSPTAPGDGTSLTNYVTDLTSTFNFTHNLSGLTQNTTYNYDVDCKDVAGNRSNSTDDSFTTPALTSTALYIDDGGNDSTGNGTSGNPWKTFSKGLSELMLAYPATKNTLISKNGTYGAAAGTGYPFINCANGTTTCGGQKCKNGTSTQRITIKAENERQAFIQGDGSATPFAMTNCSYWTVEGIRAENGDFVGSSSGSVFVFTNVNNLIIRRNLAAKNNRYLNSHLFFIENATQLLLEENELYYFHRHGMDIKDSSFITVRRNYMHSRDYANIAGGYGSNHPSRGDAPIAFYPATDSIAENNISEGNDRVMSLSGKRNTFYGNIDIGSRRSFNFSHRTDVNGLSEDIEAYNNISVNSVVAGVEATSSDTTVVENQSVFESAKYGIYANNDQPGLDTVFPEITVTNSLVLGSAQEGAFIEDIPSFNTKILEFSKLFGNTPNISSGWTQTSNTTTDPNSGITCTASNTSCVGTGANKCIVYIPGSFDGVATMPGNNTNLKNTGKNSAPIGANVAHRYLNGVLTSTKLWNQTTGEFPCGATVSGVNDDATFPNSSCVNVHKRLNVGINGCPIP